MDAIMFFLVTCLVGSGNVHMVRVKGIVQVSYLVLIVNVTQVVFSFQKEKMMTRNAILVLKVTITCQYVFS